MNKPKWNMIVDVAECTNCHLCTLATMDEYLDNDWPGYSAPMPRHGHRWINIIQKERGTIPDIDVAYVPTMCNHCDNAPCISKAENGAIRKRPDGIIVIDPAKSRGQRQLVDACPYGHIWWNEELQVPQSWNFDAHLIDDGWEKTRGSQACPTGALRTLKVSDEEIQRIVKDEQLETLNPEYGTRPRIYYKNLYRYNRCFIAGTVTTVDEGVIECLAGAAITLQKEADVIARTSSDCFGDFKIDRLEPESGAYHLHIEAEGRREKVVDIHLGQSTSVGDICL